MKNIKMIIISVALLLVVLSSAIMFYVSDEPPMFNVYSQVNNFKESKNLDNVEDGTYTILTAINLSKKLRDKKGGYMSNDVMPPFIFLDNIPNWEFGVVEILRVTNSSLRHSMTRSQSQSVENPNLVIAQPKYNMDSTTWIFPDIQDHHDAAEIYLTNFLYELNGLKETNNDIEIKSSNYQSEFYARADNLADIIQEYSKKLGSLSQRLSASIPSVRENVEFANDPSAQAKCKEKDHVSFDGETCISLKDTVTVKTPWTKVDDIFYQARGQVYAIYHLMIAMQKDFEVVIKDKNAEASYAQILRDLEATQQDVFALFIMSRTGFGMLTNHSLIMSNYISRANAAMIDLAELLKRG